MRSGITVAVKLRSVSSPRSGPDTCPSQPAVCVNRFQIVTSRATDSSRTLKSGRYLRTGALRSTLPCSTSRIIIVAANVFEIDAIGKTVCSVTGCGLLTLVIPSPRVVMTPRSRMPMATPGTLNSFIFASVSATRASNLAFGGACAEGVETIRVAAAPSSRMRFMMAGLEWWHAFPADGRATGGRGYDCWRPREIQDRGDHRGAQERRDRGQGHRWRDLRNRFF